MDCVFRLFRHDVSVSKAAADFENRSNGKNVIGDLLVQELLKLRIACFPFVFSKVYIHFQGRHSRVEKYLV